MLPSEPAQPNAGLVFDRYLKVWDTDTKLQKERFALLKRFTEEYEQQSKKTDPLLKMAHERLQSIAEAQAGTKRIVTTEERLVSGLGAAHPLENGFCFDYALGVPHLPGSAVKGLCRRMAELDEVGESTIRRLFGHVQDELDGASSAVGDVVFLPAYPETWPKLEVDIVNCHQTQYYGSQAPVLSELPGGESSKVRVGPHEIEDPVPVFFLTVARNTSFVFRAGSRSQNKQNVADALELLGRGLELLGIGAKTALGYGVMISP